MSSLPVNYLSRRLRIPSRSGSHVGRSKELAPVGSSYVLVGVLVRVGSGRSVLSLQGRELWGILIKGNYGIKAEGTWLKDPRDFWSLSSKEAMRCPRVVASAAQVCKEAMRCPSRRRLSRSGVLAPVLNFGAPLWAGTSTVPSFAFVALFPSSSG